MFPGFGERVESGLIRNGGGFLKGPMQRMPWGDHILLEKAFLVFPDGSRKHKLYLPGAIFRPNRELARRTSGASTDLIYICAYAAERGANHAVINYGVRSKSRGTETADLKSGVQTLREYVLFLLKMGPHMEHILKDLYVGMDTLATEYSWKVDEKKKQASIAMIRGLLEYDSLGRKNYPAAAMAMGGAIWNLLEREEAVQWLNMHMDQRCVQTERLISEHISLYQQLWNLVGKETAIRELVNNPDYETLPQRSKLRAIHDQLETVHLRPFVKNAKHTVRDAAAVLDIISLSGPSCNHEREQKEEYVKRLKEGIRWVFVLDALQRGIIFPLSYLIDDILRAERIKRRRTKEKGRVIITSDLAPEKFADLHDRIKTFRAKLDKCNDEALAHPVKSEILAMLDIADTHIVEDDWRYVKADLDAIAEIL
jgi:hypothetical protein